MAARHYYSSQANRDVRRIAKYIARDSVSAAVDWLDSTDSVCALIAAQPDIGERIETTGLAKARRHVHGNYLIYYRPTGSGVQILRVVHGARGQSGIV